VCSWVDDNTETEESLSALLKMMGCETQTAHDGLEAVEAAENFGLMSSCLLDIGLPKLSGLEAARRIRKQSAIKQVLYLDRLGTG
jgi:CheY-like chemotaxis protein